MVSVREQMRAPPPAHRPADRRRELNLAVSPWPAAPRHAKAICAHCRKPIAQQVGPVRDPNGLQEARASQLISAKLAGPRRSVSSREPLGAIVKTCGWACHAACGSPPGLSGRSISLPLSKRASARTRATSWGPFMTRHLAWADSISLNAIATQRLGSRVPW